MASQHLSIRLPNDTFARLDAYSQHSNRTRSDTAKTLIEEGLRMAAHPGVIFRDGPTGRRAALANGPDIWEVARVFNGCREDSDDLIQRAESLTGMGAWQLRTALRYYAEYTLEIDTWLARVDAEADQWETAWLRG